MHRLHRATDRIPVIVRIELGEAAARLHAVGGDAVDHGLAADDVVGLGEGGVDRDLVARLVEERLVAGIVRPDGRRAGDERRLRCRYRRQDLVFDGEQLGRILCLVERFGDDEGHRIADISDVVLRQDRLRADKGGAAAAALARHQRAQRAEPARPQIVPGQDGEDARRRPRRVGVQRNDAGMHMRRPHDIAARLTRQPHIVDVAAPPPQQAEILFAAHRHTDRLHAHYRDPVSANGARPCRPRGRRRSHVRTRNDLSHGRSPGEGRYGNRGGNG